MIRFQSRILTVAERLWHFNFAVLTRLLSIAFSVSRHFFYLFMILSESEGVGSCMIKHIIITIIQNLYVTHRSQVNISIFSSVSSLFVSIWHFLFLVYRLEPLLYFQYNKDTTNIYHFSFKCSIDLN